MKIEIKYENKTVSLDVADDTDFSVMIERDYEERLAEAKAKGEDTKDIVPYDVQQLFTESLNKPDYNNYHKHNRHFGMPKKTYRKDDEAADMTDGIGFINPNKYVYWLGATEEEKRDTEIENEEVYNLIRSILKPKQADLLIAIVRDDISLKDYAARENVSVSAISHRMDTVIKNFKKIFPKASTFPFCRGYQEEGNKFSRKGR